MTVPSNNQAENQQKWSKLVKRAETDEQLHQQMLNDPTPVLQGEGIEIPEGTQARVVEEDGHLQCIFESPKTAAAAAGAELTADDLSSVTGGGTKTTGSQTKSGQKVEYFQYTLKDVYVS